MSLSIKIGLKINFHICFLHLGLSDVSWKADQSITEEEVQYGASRTTRSGGMITVEPVCAGVNATIVWVPPCLPVLKIPILLTYSSDQRPVAVHLDNNPKLPKLPATLNYTKSCWIEVNGRRRFLIWTWRAMYEGDDLPSEEDIEEDVEDSDSESEGDDVVVLDDQIDTEDEELGEHTLNFKVLGVTYKGRQNYIECAKQLIDVEGKDVSVSLEPELDNPVDPGGIAVKFDTGVENYGNVCVGYIGKEFKECMTRYLQQNKINKIKIKHIKLRTQFNPIGLYILLEITKKGRWPNFVVQKCLRAR